MDKRQEYSDKYDQRIRGGESVFKQVDREENLINLMRVNMLKTYGKVQYTRLE